MFSQFLSRKTHTVTYRPHNRPHMVCVVVVIGAKMSVQDRQQLLLSAPEMLVEQFFLFKNELLAPSVWPLELCVRKDKKNCDLTSGVKG